MLSTPKNSHPCFTWLLGFTLLLVAACWLLQVFRPYKSDIPTVISFPQRDMIFQANIGSKNAVGFMQADGSAPVLIPTGDFGIVQPLWSQDKTRIYFHTVRYAARQDIGYGNMGVWETGPQDVSWCELGDWVIYPTGKTGEAIYSNGVQLILINFDGCQKEKILVDFQKQKENGIDSFCLSRDGRYVLYTEIDNSSGKQIDIIQLLDLRTGSTRTIAQDPDWVSATLSPDNRQVAFIRPDGIYVMAVDGTQVRRLVDQALYDPLFTFPTPIPNWSPDGEWLVYHKCMHGIDCSTGDHFSIFKLNVSTGQEIKLYDGGMYPYWP
jgi:Tol biopolymer transport system component